MFVARGAGLTWGCGDGGAGGSGGGGGGGGGCLASGGAQLLSKPVRADFVSSASGGAVGFAGSSRGVSSGTVLGSCSLNSGGSLEYALRKAHNALAAIEAAFGEPWKTTVTVEVPPDG